MLKKHSYLLLVLMPVILLFVWVSLLTIQIQRGTEVTVRIRGFDPMSLLSGHYISYQIDWENTDCTQFDKKACPKDDFARVLDNGAWGKSGRFYVSEQSAIDLDRAVRSGDNVAEIVYSYQKGQPPHALRLLINGQSFHSK